MASWVCKYFDAVVVEVETFFTFIQIGSGHTVLLEYKVEFEIYAIALIYNGYDLHHMQLEVYNNKMPFLCPHGKNCKKKYQDNKRKLTFSQIEIVLKLPFILYIPDFVLNLDRNIYVLLIFDKKYTTPTFAELF